MSFFRDDQKEIIKIGTSAQTVNPSMSATGSRKLVVNNYIRENNASSRHSPAMSNHQGHRCEPRQEGLTSEHTEYLLVLGAHCY